MVDYYGLIDKDEYFCERYHTLNLEPIIEHGGVQYYLWQMDINSEGVIPESKLYLGEKIKIVWLIYRRLDVTTIFGDVAENNGNLSLVNYLPQLTNAKDAITFPRGCYYKGVKLGILNFDIKVFAFPVDLDKEDFEIWRNGIKFTLRLNRENKAKVDNGTYVKFDVIKAEFYGKLLPAETIDEYVELKPKGA